MREPGHSIFRPEALRRYTETREEAVLPRLVSPRTFVFLWILLGLLVAGGVLAWSAPLPVYASGPAVVVAGRGKTPAVRRDVLVVVFLPPEFLSRMRVGQAVSLRLGTTGERLSTSILAVEPEICSPAGAQERFALQSGAARVVAQPAAVALARWQPTQSGLPPSAYVGSVGEADLAVGSRRAISLLPLVGHLFGG